MAEWTVADLLILEAGVLNRELARDIGTRLGRTKNSVIGKAHKLGLSWELSEEEVSFRNRQNARRCRRRLPYHKKRRLKNGH